MRPPHIPPMVKDMVQTAICAFDGVEFTRLAACPICGGPVTGYDTRIRTYAVVRDGEGKRVIAVRIRRFICRDCKKVSNADEPFYPGTRIGSLIIDLFLTFATTMPESRAARHIDAMGILVNRTTWRTYSGRHTTDIPTTDVFGMRLPFSVLTLSGLAAQTVEGSLIPGAEALAACGFPSALRAVPEVPVPAEERENQDKKRTG
jgi:hypothetical protein